MKWGSAYGIISETLLAAYANSGLAGIQSGVQSSGYANATRRGGRGCVAGTKTVCTGHATQVRSGSALERLAGELHDVEHAAARVHDGRELAGRRVHDVHQHR